MDSHEREFFISRITSGFLRYTCRDGTQLKIVAPNPEVMYEANEIYCDTYRKASFEGLPTVDETLNILINNDIWTLKMQDEYDILPKNIETLKIELYESVFKSELRKKIREYLKVSKEELSRLESTLNSWNHITCEGVASYAKWNHVIYSSVYCGDNKYDWSKDDLNSVVNYYYEHSLSEDQIRELSRTDPWTSMWSVYKKTGNLFPAHLTPEQRALIMWSNMYDRIYESHECPHESIIEDDDMLDGWLILQRKNREKEQAKKRGEDAISNSKIANADEIFVPADSIEDAQKIADMNSMRGQSVRASRLKQVKEKGSVKVSEFNDIKQKLNMEKAKLLSDTMKGR